MNELISKSEKLISTRELAEQLGTSPKVVLENAKKCLPNKKIENGKATYWTESEITILIEQLKCNQVNGRIFPNGFSAEAASPPNILSIKDTTFVM